MTTDDISTYQPLVMIIDDDAMARMQATGFMTQAGFRVAEAESGDDALKSIEDIAPDLILLDVEMPGIDGFELCKILRDKPAFSVTPILMLTGLENNEAIRQAYDAGATDFATKPINWSLLSHRLRYMHRGSLAAEQVRKLAYYDTLTNLPNRLLFQKNLETNLGKASGENFELAILYFDLDDFKRINDTFGHVIGDSLLQEAAKRLRHTFSMSEETEPDQHHHCTIARMGGDEFAIILSNADEKQVTEVAKNIIGALCKPFVFEGYQLFTSPSIGIAQNKNHNGCAETLLKNADMAMYEAKRAGKCAFKIHNQEMDDKAQTLYELDAQMRMALERKEFSINYQPQLDLATGELYSTEALLRWNNETLGFVSPADFIPVAEDNGLIVPIGKWVLETACAQANEWIKNGFAIPGVAVNISALQFMHIDFPEVINSVLSQTGLAPGYLELEITESLLATDINHAVSTLEKLNEIGVKLSIDDFGTGYSSLSQLKNFPIHRLKIDQSFIKNITQNNDDAAITRAVIAMSKNMNIRVLAEGVETLEHLDFLRENGCEEVQGYFISRPMTAELLQQSMPEILNTLAGLFGTDRDNTFKLAG